MIMELPPAAETRAQSRRLACRTCSAQASTDPATQIAVTGITPCRMADGYYSAAVLSSRPAVTVRSALSSSLVRRSGWA